MIARSDPSRPPARERIRRNTSAVGGGSTLDRPGGGTDGAYDVIERLIAIGWTVLCSEPGDTGRKPITQETATSARTKGMSS